MCSTNIIRSTSHESFPLATRFRRLVSCTRPPSCTPSTTPPPHTSCGNTCSPTPWSVTLSATTRPPHTFTTRSTRTTPRSRSRTMSASRSSVIQTSCTSCLATPYICTWVTRCSLRCSQPWLSGR